MNASLSRSQLRLVVLLVLVVVLGGGYFAVTHKSATQSSTAQTTPAVTTPARTTPAPSKAHAQPATPAKLDTHGLPVQVALALRKHSVVIVSLSSPGAGVDQMAAAEAQAAAVVTHSGYVNLDVRRQRPGVAILHKLGLVDTPAVLVVKRPGAVYSDFKGFVDRDVVAQAVADAR
jgi:type IV secretory pathway VirJ component